MVFDVTLAVIFKIMCHSLFKLPQDVEVWKESTKTLSATHQLDVCTTAYGGYARERDSIKGKFALTQYNQENVRQSRRKLSGRLRICKKAFVCFNDNNISKARLFYHPLHELYLGLEKK